MSGSVTSGLPRSSLTLCTPFTGPRVGGGGCCCRSQESGSPGGVSNRDTEAHLPGKRKGKGVWPSDHAVGRLAAVARLSPMDAPVQVLSLYASWVWGRGGGVRLHFARGRRARRSWERACSRCHARKAATHTRACAKLRHVTWKTVKPRMRVYATYSTDVLKTAAASQCCGSEAVPFGDLHSLASSTVSNLKTTVRTVFSRWQLVAKLYS